MAIPNWSGISEKLCIAKLYHPLQVYNVAGLTWLFNGEWVRWGCELLHALPYRIDLDLLPEMGKSPVGRWGGG